MRRIVVTGGAGFIGSNYVRYKLDVSPDVHIVVVDKMTYAGNRENLAGLPEDRYTFVEGDIANKEVIAAAMEGAEAIVNFAADTHVDRSIMGATDFISTNVTGLYNILEVARELETARVLLVSTDEVYGSIAEGSFKETDPPHPRNPYSASKAGGEMIALAHYETFGTPVIITRGSNTYGRISTPKKSCRCSLQISSTANRCLSTRAERKTFGIGFILTTMQAESIPRSRWARSDKSST